MHAPRRLQDNPLFLLLVTGVLLGLYFPLGKWANLAGVAPLAWAALIALGPGLILAVASFTRDETPLQQQHLGFAAISGFLAYVIPNGVVFAALPHVGSGLASLMYAFSPVFTAAFSIALRVRPPGRNLLLAVALGFAGAVLIVLGRNSLALETAGGWLLAAFSVPVSLACGNVFRTRWWPQNMQPLRMAALSLLAAAVPLAVLAVITGGGSALASLANAPGLALSQILLSSAMFVAFFRLQWVGGPTYLSQIGYLAAAVGLPAGVVVFGESYPAIVWAGAACVALGIVAAARKTV
ncbi:MAG: DMT family transporter [Hyphomicrobiales bacterium]